MIFKATVFIFLILNSTFLFAEMVNRIVANVAGYAITEIELVNKVKFFKKNPLFNPYHKKDKRDLDSQTLDVLIQDAILSSYAESQSITIDDKRLDNQIEGEMKAKSIKTKEKFSKELFKAYKLTIDEYKDILRQQIMYQQVAQVALQIPQVLDFEIKDWYKKNKKKLGKKYKYQIIGIPFKQGNVDSELKANKKILKAYKLAVKNFSRSAKKYSKLPNAKNGGLVNYTSIEKIAQKNPYIAQVITQLPVGKIQSEIPIQNWYYIIRVIASRSIPFDDAKEIVQQQIYLSRQQKAMQSWLNEKKRELSTQIFLKDYYEAP